MMGRGVGMLVSKAVGNKNSSQSCPLANVLFIEQKLPILSPPLFCKMFSGDEEICLPYIDFSDSCGQGFRKEGAKSI